LKTKPASDELGWQMSRLNCYACHDRDGKGGPEEARAAYFSTRPEVLEKLGDAGRLPPSLDRIGWKLQPRALAEILTGTAKPLRPHFTVRMPHFGEMQMRPFEAGFLKADAPAQPEVPWVRDPAKVKEGLRLFSAKGLDCAQCHEAASGIHIPLHRTGERLTPGYFQALLLAPGELQPGTVMPSLLEDRPQAQEEIRALGSALLRP
jgi:mono/diheme cytochrome c family protein